MPAQPLRQAGGTVPTTSIASLRPSRPKTGAPQVSRLSSLVCSGPLMRSQLGNVMFTLSRHQEFVLRSSR